MVYSDSYFTTIPFLHGPFLHAITTHWVLSLPTHLSISFSVSVELELQQEQEQVQDGREITGFGAVFIVGNPGKQEEK